MKKFELTSEFVTFLGKKLFRIKALVSFGDVKEGELGGLVEKEENLDQSGDARVYGDAWVSGDAGFKTAVIILLQAASDREIGRQHFSARKTAESA